MTPVSCNTAKATTPTIAIAATVFHVVVFRDAGA